MDLVLPLAAVLLATADARTFTGRVEPDGAKAVFVESQRGDAGASYELRGPGAPALKRMLYQLVKVAGRVEGAALVVDSFERVPADLRACAAAASPAWRVPGLRIELLFDGEHLLAVGCQAIEADARDFKNPDNLGGPGAELRDAQGAVLFRFSGSARGGLLCPTTEIPPPPGPGGGHFANVAVPASRENPHLARILVPLLPRAATLVWIDRPCGGSELLPAATLLLE